MKGKLIFTIALIIAFPVTMQAGIYNIKDFGAIADGQTVNTESIQKAIDACFSNGGGSVVVPNGTFITGTLQLKSNVNLYLESGSVLKGSAHITDYLKYSAKPTDSIYFGMFYTYQANNVSITGQGTLDGNEKAFFIWDQAKKISLDGSKYTRQGAHYREVVSGIGDGPVTPRLRPYQMIIFSDCTNVLVRDIRITGSPFWTLHFADCDGVIASGLKIWNSLDTPNSDGMDITSCSNVLVSDCDIKAGDDAIVITGFAVHFEVPGFHNISHVSKNIDITNCNLQSRSSGIRVGYIDQNSVRNINVSNVNISNSNRGIGIFLRGEGSLENMNFSNITIETRMHTGDWWGNGEPIHISAIRGKENLKLGKISNVRFSNILCKGENGILVYGTDESNIENVSFNGISFVLAKSAMEETAGGNIDLRGCMDEKYAIFAHDIPGFFAQYVNNLTINDFKLVWENKTSPFYTHGIEVENFKHLKITNFNGSGAPDHPYAYRVSVSNGEGFVTDVSHKFILKKNVKDGIVQ